MCFAFARTCAVDSKTLKAVNSTLGLIAKERELAEKAQKDKLAVTAPKPAPEAVASKPAAKKTVKGRATIKVGNVYDEYGQEDAYDDDDDDEFAGESTRAKAPSAPKAAPAATGGYYDDEGFI